MTPVTHRVLEHVLDARSINIDQHRVLFDPATEEVDSLGEWIAGLPISTAERRRGLRFVRDLMDLNEAEGSLEQSAAGLLDPVVGGRRLREEGLTAKQIASRLRRPLRADSSYVAAVRAVRAELARVEVADLRGRGVSGELTKAQGRRLHAILDAIEAA